MADLSKIRLNGTVYNFKDAQARSDIPSAISELTNDEGYIKQYYGTCSTAKGTAQKEVIIDQTQHYNYTGIISVCGTLLLCTIIFSTLTYKILDKFRKDKKEIELIKIQKSK